MLTLTKGWDRAKQIREIVGEALEEIVEPIIYAEALDLIEGPPGGGPQGLPGVGGARGHRLAPGPCIWGSTAPSPAGWWWTTKAVTPARWTSTPTDLSRPRPCGSWPRPKGIDLGRVVGLLGTSYTDLPMLEAVGHPVAVNPDRVLAKVAREREAEVMQFTKPVRLRGRVPRSQLVDDRRRGRCHLAACQSERWWPGDWHAVPRSDPTPGFTGRPLCSAYLRSLRLTPLTAERGKLERAVGLMLGAKPLGGDNTQGNHDGEDDELLHGADGTRSAAGPRRCPRDGSRRRPVVRSDSQEVPRSGVLMKDGEAWTWPGPRSDGSAHGSG